MVVIRFLAFFCASFMASKRVSRSLASFMVVMTVFRFMYSSVLLADASLALALWRGGWVSFFPMSFAWLVLIRVSVLLSVSLPLALGVLTRLLVFFWSSFSVVVVVFRFLASPPLLMVVLGVAGVMLVPRLESLGVAIFCPRATLWPSGVSPSLRAEVFLYLLGVVVRYRAWFRSPFLTASSLCWSWGSWSGPWFPFVPLASP